jgi:N-acetylglucosamine malate deacetylase 1
MRILALHAHPDDLEFLAAGTLALLAAAGHSITMASMTGGDCGSREHGPDELARIRRGEAAAAAKLIGASYECVGFRDMRIFNDDESRHRVTEFIRSMAPELVLTASPSDYHADHEATSLLVRDALFAAPIPNYQTGAAPPLEAIPHLYFVDPVEGLDREGNRVMPSFLIDITSTIETKRAMLACHESQRRWLQQHHGMDNYMDEMEHWTKARGDLSGVAYAEGFRPYHVHPYPRTSLLESSLGAYVRKPSAKPMA